MSYMAGDGTGWTDRIAEHQHATRKRFINRMVDAVEGCDNSAFARGAMIA
jgi:hypothetical protein